MVKSNVEAFIVEKISVKFFFWGFRIYVHFFSNMYKRCDGFATVLLLNKGVHELLEKYLNYKETLAIELWSTELNIFCYCFSISQK